MADQIKNENLGETGSQANEEKVEATKRKEPKFADPRDKKASSNDGAGGNSQDESKPDKKLPNFADPKDEAGGDVPPRKEPVIKAKERKLPVFANEVKQHRDDDEFGDDIDFTSDSVAMPFAMGPIVNLDASEVEVEGGKKKKKAKKGKDKGKYKASKEKSDDLSKIDPYSMDHIDELSFTSANMPSVGNGGVDNYLDLANAVSAPYGVDGYLDLTNAMSKAYVPTYEEENVLFPY